MNFSKNKDKKASNNNDMNRQFNPKIEDIKENESSDRDD